MKNFDHENQSKITQEEAVVALNRMSKLLTNSIKKNTLNSSIKILQENAFNNQENIMTLEKEIKTSVFSK